jgi:hypothetical protein
MTADSHFYQDRAVAIKMKYFWNELHKSERLPLTFGEKVVHGRWYIRTAAGWVIVNEQRRAT